MTSLSCNRPGSALSQTFACCVLAFTMLSTISSAQAPSKKLEAFFRSAVPKINEVRRNYVAALVDAARKLDSSRTVFKGKLASNEVADLTSLLQLIDSESKRFGVEIFSESSLRSASDINRDLTALRDVTGTKVADFSSHTQSSNDDRFKSILSQQASSLTLRQTAFSHEITLVANQTMDKARTLFTENPSEFQLAREFVLALSGNELAPESRQNAQFRIKGLGEVILVRKKMNLEEARQYGAANNLEIATPKDAKEAFNTLEALKELLLDDVEGDPDVGLGLSLGKRQTFFANGVELPGTLAQKKLLVSRIFYFRDPTEEQKQELTAETLTVWSSKPELGKGLNSTFILHGADYEAHYLFRKIKP